jgi:DNA repair protein RecO (recombination protein O)
VSEILKDSAVVLRTHDFGESSTVVVALTRAHGKLRLLAKGARRKNSPFAGSLRTGSVVHIVFYFRRERGLQLLSEISGRSAFETGGNEFERLCMFQAGLEIIDRSLADQEADEKVFDLLVHFIDAIPGCLDPWSEFFRLEAGLLEALGLFPSMTICGNCRSALGEGGVSVHPSSGEVTCRACAGEGACNLSPDSYSLLSRMSGGLTDGAGLARMKPMQRREIGELLHKLFLYHIDRYRLPNALRYLREVNQQ